VHNPSRSVHMVILRETAYGRGLKRSSPQIAPPYYCYDSVVILLGKRRLTPNGENDEI